MENLNIQSPQLCDNLKEPAYAKYNGIAGAESSRRADRKITAGTYISMRRGNSQGKLHRWLTIAET